MRYLGFFMQTTVVLWRDLYLFIYINYLKKIVSKMSVEMLHSISHSIFGLLQCGKLLYLYCSQGSSVTL